MKYVASSLREIVLQDEQYDCNLALSNVVDLKILGYLSTYGQVKKRPGIYLFLVIIA